MALKIGTATAALQIEGSMPESPWHGWARDGHVKDGTSPNPTTDHWRRWEEDNQLMESLGYQISRLSVEWARLEPTLGNFDEQAFERYREELNDLKIRGIQPLVTLHHFGHPQWFEDMGAFTKAENVDLFIRFVETVVTHLGDLIDDWITINEPNVYVTQAYLFREGPPGDVNWFKLRSALRNLARAHVKSYQLIHERLDQPGRAINVTFANHRRVFAPMNPKNPLHRFFTKVDEKLFHTYYEKAFYSGIFHPVLGGAPDISPGRYADAIAINYYSRTAVTGLSDGVFPGVPTNDLNWEIYPEGLIQAATDLYNSYHLPIWVTENGTCDNFDPTTGKLEKFRCSFIIDHLEAIAACALPFERYYHWCFVDNWEWSEGMAAQFGVVALDENLDRRPKPSAYLLRDIIAAGGITPEIKNTYREAGL